MNVARVLFFGRFRDITGVTEMQLEAPTLSALRARLVAQHPALAEALSASGVVVAVDKIIRHHDIDLTAASEVAFMPPLSGG